MSEARYRQDPLGAYEDEDGFNISFTITDRHMHDPQPETLGWCLDQFGAEGFEMKRWVSGRGLTVWFVEESDALAFKLRWC